MKLDGNYDPEDQKDETQQVQGDMDNDNDNDSTKAQGDDDQAKINAFIQDEEDQYTYDNIQDNQFNANNLQMMDPEDEDPISPFNNNGNININNNNNNNKNGLFGYIGNMFKNKKGKKKNNKSNNNNNNNNNDIDGINDDINNMNNMNNINMNNGMIINNGMMNMNQNNNQQMISPMSVQHDAMYAQQINQFGQFGQNIQHNLNQNEKAIIDKVGGDLPWNCEKCTFLNEATELHCTMCYYSRFEVKNLSAQWQWKADQRWITYGIPETTEIEEAYKSGAKEVSLTKGWFAQNPNLYKIYFDQQHGNTKSKHKVRKNKKKGGGNDDQYHDFDENSTYFYQINSDSQTRREVRRIGDDDESLFRKLALKDLDEQDRKCMVCLNEFTVEEEQKGIIVQLSTCKNHGFHKDCIVQWVQLKGHCPLCRKET